MDWELVHDYVETLLSAPVIAGIVALVFLCMFKADIKTLMGRMAAKFRFPGGGELLISQSERQAKELSPRSELPPVETEELPKGLNLAPEQVQELTELIQAERANATLWEYRYLNLYLVPMTQFALDIVANSDPRFTRRLLYDFLQQDISSAAERLAICNALESHSLIEEASGLLQVTDKGRDYIKWRGPLQVPPPKAG